MIDPQLSASAPQSRRVGWRAGLQQFYRGRLVRNILTTISGSAGAQAINLALIPVIMRIYGPDAFGVVGTFQSLIIILIPWCALTYPMAIVLPVRDDDARGLIRLSLLIAATVCAASALLLYGYGAQFAASLGIDILTPYLMLLPIVMFSSAVLEITQQWLYRTQRFSLTARAATLHALLYNATRSLAGLIQSSAPVLVVTSALYYVIHSSLLLIGIRLGGDQIPLSNAHPSDVGQRKSLRQLALDYRDFPVYRAPQVLINALSVHMPTLVLASAFGAVPAGFFALCLQVLAMPSNFIGKAVGSVYYPRITQATHAHEPVTRLLARGVAGMALAGLVPFATLAIAGPWLFGLAFGAQWEPAGEYARWLALSEFAGFIGGPCQVAIPALSLQKRFLVFEIVSTSLRISAVFTGALFFKEALAVVMAFAAANVVINLSMIAIVLFEGHRGYRRQIA
ncbi:MULTISPECIES: oligosaccharide flippase family protein [unclassified Pseudomonas]|uniref:lipopolysaccharide biosynthesis protein n=1 Tax=unclassified Pseudomonas TaxID=196821 RepID=UPI002AC8BFF6|nr:MULTISPECIES: oligosaccharide flippase family protein [unclassified Pseudomonas]MEB0039871.1 oligosaccharide flippase family protein [Pseudomonas sp. MH10]MEB0077187.1 oligosaccharide flippase family protein [Pseudomonas sp. MH10out]MEB0091482.1 oligosaccharide flippase family protein [Pseudomonas sp. CCI4.2]MEB0101534.1 oligosaccharide flippase family protein [Pseudomonas sp. CCI3.2]MEB0120645.1 oligosaccharide flippase family protein [Pseudomonas sp. CCI1.2]